MAMIRSAPRCRAATTPSSREAIHHRRVDLAVRRLLSAVSYRTDPADKLIDAAVALENLFGTRQGEVTFRIAAATARLMGSDGFGATSFMAKRLTLRTRATLLKL
jgi:hypothetical protein